MNAKEAVAKASERIPTRDAETLLLFVVGRDRAWLLAHPEADLRGEQVAHFEALVSRRAKREPVQYLTGRQEFFGLEFAVSKDVLIPRPETELLVEAVLEWAENHAGQAGRALRMVDVGTGSGAIAVTLGHKLPEANVTALDLSKEALQVAKRNAERLGSGKRLRFVQSDLLNAVQGEAAQGYDFDVVVSNPPYVPLRDAAAIQPEVREFEPHLALFAGEDGMAVYRRLIPQAAEVLRPGGLLALEFGYEQREALAELLGEWRAVQFRDDYAGIPRVALAERP